MIAILCSSDHVKTLKQFLQENGLSQIKVFDMETKRCAEYDPSYTPPVNHPPKDDDEILLLYTAGTTGKLKGCLFNHTAVCQAMTSVKSAYKTLPTDVFYTQFNYSNPFALIHYLMAPLMAGASVFISDQTDFQVILTNLAEHRVTRMHPLPNTLPSLIRFSEENKMPIVTVKYFSLYGIPPSKEILETVKKLDKTRILSVYGLTEALGTIAVTTPETPIDSKNPHLIGSVLLGTKFRLLDQNNDEIDKKKPQKGQLVVMGPSLMTRYLDLPDEQKVTVRGTWLFTGDFVEVDQKTGHLTYLSRLADIIRHHDGTEILPHKMESLLCTIPHVQEAAYVAVPNAMNKLIPTAIIVREEGSPLSEKSIIEALAAKQIRKEYLPEKIVFTDFLPKTPVGNINRWKLRKIYSGS